MTQIEQIKAEIERRISDNTFGAKLELIDLLSFIESLEKEQDVDLEKEMNRLVSLEYNNSPDDEWEMVIARHFYEFGLNAKDSTHKIKGWVARDSKGWLFLSKENPIERVVHQLAQLDNSFFPNLLFGDEPIEVELTISRVKTE